MATLNDGTWNDPLLKADGGRDASCGAAPLDGTFRYTYYDNTSGYIRTDQRMT